MATGNQSAEAPALAQLADEYENICGICFTPIHAVDNPRGRLNSCDHVFCSYCITKWADSTNVCPHCKALFTRVFTWDPEAKQEKCKKVRRRKFWNFGDPSDLFSSQDDDDDTDTDNLEWTEERLMRHTGQPTVQCDVCHSDHNAARMIFCDRRECTFVAHLECLGLTQAPITFFCPACTSLRSTPSAGLSADQQSATASQSEPPTVRARKATRATASEAAAPHASGSVAVASPPAPKPPAKVPMERPAVLRGRVPPSATAARTPNSTAVRAPEAVANQAPVNIAQTALSHVDAPRPISPAEEDNDYYFMVPTAHALSAFTQLRRRQHELADIHQKQRDRRAAVVQRYQAAFAATHPADPRSPSYAPSQKRRRSSADGEGRSQTQEMHQQLDHMESELMDPRTRAVLEEQLAKDWARDMVPILRRNRSIESNRLRLDSNMNIIVGAPQRAEDIQREERGLWEQAMANARAMARQKLDARAAAIRMKREELVKAQAQREAAALTKLARIIALHRQRDGLLPREKVT